MRDLRRLAKPLPLLLGLLLLVGAARFGYALTASVQGWSGLTYLERGFARHPGSLGRPTGDEVSRRWGPLLLLAMRGVERVALPPWAVRTLLRAMLVGFYLLTIVMLLTLLPEREPSALDAPAIVARALLAVLCLQSTAAIYAISNGMVEILMAFCVIGHLHCFLRRRYLAAALLICAGVYLKLFAIVFLVPYAVFALLSRAHRRYCVHVLVAGLLVASLSLAAEGWRYGFFYPFTMVHHILTDPRDIPLRSREVFGLLFLFDRLVSSFRVGATVGSAHTKALASIFTGLLLVSTTAAAVVLARTERVWNRGTESRRVALLAFQATLGFLLVAFSLDISITHLLLVAVSVHAPLLLAVDRRGVPGFTPGAAVTFGLGLVLIGNLIPLSLMLGGLPLAWLDRLAGNAPGDLLRLEKYIWYQVPLLGVACLALSGTLVARRRLAEMRLAGC